MTRFFSLSILGSISYEWRRRRLFYSSTSLASSPSSSSALSPIFSRPPSEPLLRLRFCKTHLDQAQSPVEKKSCFFLLLCPPADEIAVAAAAAPGSLPISYTPVVDSSVQASRISFQAILRPKLLIFSSSSFQLRSLCCGLGLLRLFVLAPAATADAADPFCTFRPWFLRGWSCC